MELLMSKAIAARQQKEFDKKYITSSEIVAVMGVSRAAIVNARKRGILPEPVIVRGTGSHIWIRDEITANLKAWKTALEVRRGNIAG